MWFSVGVQFLFAAILPRAVNPKSGAFLTPGSGMGNKSGSGSRINNPDHYSESVETIFWVKILKYFDADPDLGSEIILTRDPG
jgi:hypothetical protein